MKRVAASGLVIAVVMTLAIDPPAHAADATVVIHANGVDPKP
jgi:hypothetical protein